MGLVGMIARENVTELADGVLNKPEYCQRCTKTFIYLIYRQAAGSAMNPLWLDHQHAQEKAGARASLALNAELAKGIDPVLCPYCGYLQPHMVEEARRRRGSTALWIGPAVSVLLAVLAALVAPEGAGFAFWLMGFAIGMGFTVGLWFAWRKLYNPNEGREFHWPLNKETSKSGMRMEDYDASVKAAADIELERYLDDADAEKQRKATAQQQQQQRDLEATQKRLDAEARRETEMRRIADNAKRDQPPWES